MSVVALAVAVAVVVAVVAVAVAVVGATVAGVIYCGCFDVVGWACREAIHACEV